LAGVSLLVRGRHDLYVSALAALLTSRGARVWESSAGERAPAKLPRGVEAVILGRALYAGAVSLKEAIQAGR